ncbi:MAG: 50S ribosomal protein L4 [Bacteriovoracaceae bacterium]|nr:50S ribosomal protein L4 [Bacteriovoracaceae bacterium]
MSEINVLDSKFKKSGSLKTNVDLSPEVINIPVVHQVVKATLAGRRAGTACTKNKAMVSGGGKKPFKQKGTGRARQGSSRSPLMIGGGVAFGPVPRSFEQKVNKKHMLVALTSIIADKLQSGKLHVVESLTSTGKTKELYSMLSDKNLLPGLIITNSADSKVILAAKNIKNSIAIPVSGFSVYEAVKYENLIIEKEALEKLLSRLV